MGASQKAFSISMIRSVLLSSASQFSHALPHRLLLIHFINLDSLLTDFSRGSS